MYTIKDIMHKIELLSPLNLAEPWDNVGILVGDNEQSVSRVMCALDLNYEIIKEAIDKKVDCIVTHHPYIFSPLKKIDFSTPVGQGIRLLIQNNISLISIHTNLDSAKGGINDIICDGLGINNTKVLNKFYDITEKQFTGLGRFGTVPPISLENLIQKVKLYFNIDYARIVGDCTKNIQTISVCSGSGSSLIKEAAMVSDVFITGDVKFHEAQDAINKGLIIIDVGHYASEQVAIPKLRDYLDQNLDIEIICTEINGEVFKTM